MRDVLDVCRLCRGTPKGIAVVIGVLAAILTTRLHAPVLRAASASEMRVLSHGYVDGRGKICDGDRRPGWHLEHHGYSVSPWWRNIT